MPGHAQEARKGHKVLSGRDRPAPLPLADKAVTGQP